MHSISRQTKLLFITAVSILVVVMVAITALLAMSDNSSVSRGAAEVRNSTLGGENIPELRTDIVVSNLDHPWEVAFLPSGEMLVTERAGTVSLYEDGKRSEIAAIADAYAVGEGGLMGLEVDRDFARNNFIYTCYASSAYKDVRLVRWKLLPGVPRLQGATPIVTGIPLNPSGRHSGCRVKMAPSDDRGILMVGTGDAAIGTHPQDPKSLGGKILRINREGGSVDGNLGEPFDKRIYSFGHRNTQGIAHFKTGVSYAEAATFINGFSVEHGPNIDDEINPLLPGNFGWDPVPGYNESVAMSDKKKFPESFEAVWSSGEPTLAPSGAEYIIGEQWGAFDGALAVAFLKAEQLRMQKYGLTKNNAEEGYSPFKADGTLRLDHILFRGQFGRLRTVVQGPDGGLYLATDNGGGRDQVIKITPRSK